MSIGGLNTFLSSWADHLEPEMLHMSEFHTGSRISFLVLFVFSLFPHLKRFLPPPVSPLEHSALHVPVHAGSRAGRQSHCTGFIQAL